MKRERLEPIGVKYPHVHMRLVGEDGSTFFILSRVSGAMRKAGIPAEEIRDFHREATSGDYDHLLRTVMATVTCDGDEEEMEDK